MSNERRSPITGELQVARSSDVPESRWQHLWGRVSHIYRTRVRTTTVLLVVIFLVGIVLYMFSASHYGVITDLPEQQQGPAPTARVESPTTRTPEPTMTTPSASVESPDPAELSTVPSTVSPSATTSTHPIFPRLPTTSHPPASQ